MTEPGAVAADGTDAPDAPVFDALALGTAIQRRIGVKTSRDEPLARFTTMRVGGPADLFASVHNIHELRAIVRFARSRGIPLTLLGRGSDVVIADAGIRGLVVQNRAEGARVEGDRYVAESGLPMARAATETQQAGLTGLEFGLAIPGTVGGAVWANAGAHDGDVAGILESADVLLGDGTEARLTVTELDFRYRGSRLKDHPDEVVLAATFHLAPADPATIAARLDDIKRWRREHQPLGIPSAGSTFRNPPGDSAGRLIDSLGWKGRTRGGATVSEKHANFIVNDRRGRAGDVRGLVDEVAAAVAAASGIVLQPEIVFLGDWEADQGGAPEPDSRPASPPVSPSAPGTRP